jgi:DNA-binding response OmpR family regulator
MRLSTNLPAETILLAEGEVLVRYAIADYLRECGYRVVEVSSAEEALEVFREPAIGVSILLSSAELAGPMDGFALARWVRANRADVGVMLAGTISREADAAAELCDKGPMLSRPYEPQAVVDRIRRLLAERKRS